MNRPDHLACERWDTTLLLRRIADAAFGDAAALGVPAESLIFSSDDEVDQNPWTRHQIASFERA